MANKELDICTQKLSKMTEEKLWKKILAGDKEARAKFIRRLKEVRVRADSNIKHSCAYAPCY